MRAENMTIIKEPIIFFLITWLRISIMDIIFYFTCPMKDFIITIDRALGFESNLANSPTKYLMRMGSLPDAFRT